MTMRAKKNLKIAVDIAMTLLLLSSMGYAVFGDFLHEVFGTALFVLFFIHHILNGHWYKALFKGRYSPYRLYILILNILLTLCLFGLMASGIMMSKHMFAFLDINGGMSFARLLHLSDSHWGFIVMSLHIGVHINPMVQKATRKSRKTKYTLATVGVLLSALGIYSFIRRDFADYMFLKTQFAFMNFSESPIVFYIEHLAIMSLFISVSHYIGKLLKSKSKSNKVM